MREEFSKAHPLGQLMIMIALGFGFMFVMIVLTLIPLFVAGNGLDVLQTLLSADESDPGSLVYVKVLQITQSIGLFICPYLVYRYFGHLPSYDHGFTTNRVLPVLLFGITMACAFPLVNWLALINSNLHLPEFLSGVEEWIYSTEAQAEALIKKFLSMDSAGDLAFNLVVIALVPALSEELFFRGAVQPIFQRWLKNGHLAVWVTAFVFSFIHLQFLGFLPRFLLGAVLGYAALWSNSLLVPIIGHFVNNALAVITAWFIGEESLATDYAFFESDAETHLYAAISLAIVLAGMFALQKLRVRLPDKTTVQSQD